MDLKSRKFEQLSKKRHILTFFVIFEVSQTFWILSPILAQELNAICKKKIKIDTHGVQVRGKYSVSQILTQKC